MSANIFFFLSWLRISNSFPRLPEIWVQRWEHRVLAGMWRLQVGLGGWPSLESWADLSEVHPASSLQGGQFMKSFWGQDSTFLGCCGWSQSNFDHPLPCFVSPGAILLYLSRRWDFFLFVCFCNVSVTTGGSSKWNYILNFQSNYNCYQSKHV